MSGGKKARDRRRWSPPEEPDPRLKEFTLPFARRETDAARLQLKGWLKLGESALTTETDGFNPQADIHKSDDTESKDHNADSKP